MENNEKKNQEFVEGLQSMLGQIAAEAIKEHIVKSFDGDEKARITLDHYLDGCYILVRHGIPFDKSIEVMTDIFSEVFVPFMAELIETDHETEE